MEVPTASAQQTATLGYLLAYDPFGDGYELIRLEINDEVVFDAEKGIAASVNFRFYGGTQTAPDPITQAVMGDRAGAWQGFVMLFLSGYVADSAPSVKAVISNAATDTPAGGVIAWTGTPPSGNLDAFQRGSAYDPAANVIYQILEPTDIPGLTHIYLAILDVETLQERYRVPLEGSEPYAFGRDVVDYQLSQPIVMRGTGLLLVQFLGNGVSPHLSAIYDAATGHLIASQVDIVNMDWLTVQQFGHLWVFLGVDHDAAGVSGIFDPTAGTFTVAAIDGPPVISENCRGRATTGYASFFVSANTSFTTTDVYEVRFDGDAWTSINLLTVTSSESGSVSVLWFDPLTGFLVVGYWPGEPALTRFIYVNPDTGAIVDTFDGPSPKGYVNSTPLIWELNNRLVSKPGFVLMLQTNEDINRDVDLLDIQGKTISTFASDVVPEFTDITRRAELIFDQGKGLWITALGEYAWTVHRQQNTIPGEVSLRWIITKVMFLAGYSPEELIFDGFGPPDGGDPDPDPDPVPEPEPADALVALKFLTEAYTVHGSTVTAADVIDKPDRVGASGLEIPLEDVDGVVSAIGDSLTDLLTMNWTVVIEWEELTTDGATYLLYLADVDNNHSIVIERSTAFTGLRVDTHEGASTSGTSRSTPHMVRESIRSR